MTYHLWHLVFIGGVMFMAGLALGLWAGEDTINYYKSMYYIWKEEKYYDKKDTHKDKT